MIHHAISPGRDFDGRVALVTGASSGLGRVVAQKLAERGAAVVCSDLREEPVAGGFDADPSLTTVEVIEQAGGRASFVACDVTKVDDHTRAVAAAASTYGGLDVLVNNAGIWPGFGTVLEEAEDTLDRVLAVNLKGVYAGCRVAIEQMRRQGRGGRIVNVSSIAGLVGLKGEPAYCTSKAAMVGLTKQLAVDFGPEGIAVNVVCPGFLATALSRETLGVNTAHDLTPWPRMGTVEEAAEPIVFLASEAAGFVNGAVLAVDGGFTAR